jgi:hypothetical protein
MFRVKKMSRYTVYGLDNTKSKTIGERPRTANKMLCYVIHGLSTRYTIAAGYFFHSTLTTAQFSQIMVSLFFSLLLTIMHQM